MFKADKIKALVNKRLSTAAEEIFNLFVQTIKEYEEIVFQSQQELERQRRMGRREPLQLSALEGSLSDDRHLDKMSCQDEEGQEPLQIKEEQEDLWMSKLCEKQEEPDSNDAMFNIIYVQKSEQDRKQFVHQKQVAEDERRLAHSSSKEHKSQTVGEICGALVPNSINAVNEASVMASGGFPSGLMADASQAGEKTDRPYSCNICNKKFKVRSVLTRHIKTHTGEKPYRCNVCDKSFIQRSYLHTHMNSHSEQKPYMCSFCGKGFTQLGNMNVHIRIHTGERPHRCGECGKNFREKADLVKHKIIHTGEKPYACSVCNMKFSAQSNLTRHMRTHSGERPYSCTVCGKRFIQRSHLVIHVKRHLAENIKT
ncbi:zinc finger protein 28-like [Takifugu flavidus]|nr:zinc finger protein 28-like [Takifugu flavidus]